MTNGINFKKIYTEFREKLTPGELEEMLSKGKKYQLESSLVKTLAQGGSALFPHVDIQACGGYVAAVAYAALAAAKETGKNHILMVGVLHSITPNLKQAMELERARADLTKDPCRGVFGKDLPHEELLSVEFSTDNFMFILEAIAKKESLELPPVTIRYVNLAAGHPETLPRLEEIQKVAHKAIVVATSDLCHHGVSYGDSPVLTSEEGLKFARHEIEKGFPFLAKRSFLEYRDYALFQSKNDSKEIGQILTYLLGPLHGHILDLHLADVSYLFENKSPNWIAAALVELKLVL